MANSGYNLYLGYNDDLIETFNEIVLTLECLKWYDTEKLKHLNPKSSPDSNILQPSMYNNITENSNNEQDEFEFEFDPLKAHPAVRKILNRNGSVSSSQVLKIMNLISRSRSFGIMTNKAPYRIPLDSPYHPYNRLGYHYNNPDGKNIVMSGYIHNTNPKTSNTYDSLNWYSWQDLSQQLYTDAGLLKLYATRRVFGKYGLRIDECAVKDVVDRMILGLSCLIVFKNKNDISLHDLDKLYEYYNGVPLNSTQATKNNKTKQQQQQHTLTITDSSIDAPGEGDEDIVVNEDDDEAAEIKLSIPKESSMLKNMSVKSSKPVKVNSTEKINDFKNDIENEVNSKKLEDEKKSCVSFNNAKSIDDEDESIDFDKYLYYQLDNRLVMVQWPLFVCGLCSVRPEQKIIIDCCFHALMNLGVGSGEISLSKLRKVWDLQKDNNFDYATFDLFNDESDSVPFT
ncbi:unnamed protein product [[Candida] boidinii]|nr:unnamed protein product [[Candida] boidinii]